MIAFRLLVLALLDAAAVAAGALLLWINAGSTVVNGSAVGNLLALLATGILLVFRQLCFTVFTRAETAALSTQKHRGLALGSTVVQATLTLALAAAWLTTRSYFLGWVLCFASVFLMLSARLQLLGDVLLGSRRQRMRRDRSLALQRLLSVEVMRLIAAGIGIIGLVLGTTVHRWEPALLNPLIVMIALTIGLSVAVARFLGSLLERGSSRETDSDNEARTRRGREAPVPP